jgi:hypothetical protein
VQKFAGYGAVGSFLTVVVKGDRLDAIPHTGIAL